MEGEKEREQVKHHTSHQTKHKRLGVYLSAELLQCTHYTTFGMTQFFFFVNEFFVVHSRLRKAVSLIH